LSEEDRVLIKVFRVERLQSEFGITGTPPGLRDAMRKRGTSCRLVSVRLSARHCVLKLPLCVTYRFHCYFLQFLWICLLSVLGLVTLGVIKISTYVFCMQMILYCYQHRFQCYKNVGYLHSTA